MSKAEDPTHNWNVTTTDLTGNVVPDDAATDKLKADFQDFLTFVASHCPPAS